MFVSEKLFKGESKMDVLNSAKELAKALQESDAYVAMSKAREENDKNIELQEKISNFNLKKIALNRETAKEERNSDKISTLDREIREAYQDIMNDPNMKAYSEAKGKVDELMKKIEYVLGMALNGADPETIEVPESTGCSGNCSSCSGCH
jgi:cell fate (sporulation/competence/biofilm development) regulator YlbF (YheA/YmcA/DUF963 family)